MTKNVTVVDENNYNYGTTYRKRADGLVKTGRACFIDDNTIMLTCPPEISQAEKERLDKIMENNNINNQLTEEAEEVLNQSTEQSESDTGGLMGKIKRMSGSSQSDGQQLLQLLKTNGTSVSNKSFIETQIEKIIDNLIKNSQLTTNEGSEMIQGLFGYMISYKNVEVKLAIVNAINEMVKSADMDNESVIAEIAPIVDTMHHIINTI